MRKASTESEKSKVVNIISVDLEDWYHLGFADDQVEGIKNSISEPFVVKHTLSLLDIFRRFHIRATFFCLGMTAQRYPDLIKEIARESHEVASHGYSHIPLNKLESRGFEYEVKKSVEVLSTLCEQKIIGYRAPHLSMKQHYGWAYSILQKNGFLYDSSLKAVSADGCFALKGAYYEVYIDDLKSMLEFPVSTLNLFGMRIACAGGTCLRMLPGIVIGNVIGFRNRREEPVHMYLHPRDVALVLPRLSLSLPDHLRYHGHYGNMMDKVGYLLSKFSFTSVRAYLTF